MYNFKQKTIICPDCGIEFNRTSPTHAYCSECGKSRKSKSLARSVEVQKQKVQSQKQVSVSLAKLDTASHDRERLRRMAWSADATGWSKLASKVYAPYLDEPKPEKGVCACLNDTRRQCAACKQIFCTLCKSIKHPTCPKRETL